MSIYLNNNLTMQPSVLKETPMPVQTDVTALDGSLQRNYLGQKYMAEMTFDQLTISGYNQIIGLVNSGAAVGYKNTQSALTGGTLTYSGLASFTSHAYVKGASLYQQLDLVIRQY